MNPISNGSMKTHEGKENKFLNCTKRPLSMCGIPETGKVNTE